MRLQIEIEIARPADEVFDYISNFENNPEWQTGLEAARFITRPPLRKGSQYEQVTTHRRGEIVTRFEVTDLQPGRSITIQSVESAFPIRVTRRVEPLDGDRSRVIAETQSEPRGIARFLGPLIRRFAQHAVNDDYQRLKDLLEQPS